MFRPSRFLRCLLIVSCIISTQITDVVLEKFLEESKPSSLTESQRKAAEKYLQKLKETKKEWVDPNDKLKSEEKNIDLSSETVTEYQRKQGEKYLQKLKETTKQWVDPYDMLKSKETKLDLPSEKSHKISTVSITNKLAMESDFKPTFSDIRGEIIDGKSVADDDILPTADHEKDSGKILSDTRQEICVLDSIYVTRWLKKLITKLESYSTSEPTSLSFSVNRDTLDMLQKVSESKSLDIGDLDDLICQLINKATVNYGSIDWESLIPSFMYTLWIIVAFVCVLCVLYTFYNSILYHTKLTLFIIFIVVNVLWHWMCLYQQKLADKHAVLSSLTISNQCSQTDMGILEHITFYFKSFFTTGDCNKYYQAVMVDAIWEVSLSVAVADAITAFLFQPLEVIARAINNGLKYLFDDLSFFAVIALIIFIVLLTIMLCNYKIKLPFFLGSLEPSTSGSSIEDIKLRKTSKMQRLLLSNAESLSDKLGLDAIADADPPCRKHSCTSKDIILVGRNDGCCQTAECRFKNVKTCMITGGHSVHKVLHKSDHHFNESSCCSTELVDDFKRVQTCSCRTENVVSLVNKECQCCCMKKTIDEIKEKEAETCITEHDKPLVQFCMKPEANEKTLPVGESTDVHNIPECTEDSCKDCCDKNSKDICVTNDPRTVLIQSSGIESITELSSH